MPGIDANLVDGEYEPAFYPNLEAGAPTDFFNSNLLL